MGRLTPRQTAAPAAQRHTLRQHGYQQLEAPYRNRTRTQFRSVSPVGAARGGMDGRAAGAGSLAASHGGSLAGFSWKQVGAGGSSVAGVPPSLGIASPQHPSPNPGYGKQLLAGYVRAMQQHVAVLPSGLSRSPSPSMAAAARQHVTRVSQSPAAPSVSPAFCWNAPQVSQNLLSGHTSPKASPHIAYRPDGGAYVSHSSNGQVTPGASYVSRRHGAHSPSFMAGGYRRMQGSNPGSVIAPNLNPGSVVVPTTMVVAQPAVTQPVVTRVVDASQLGANLMKASWSNLATGSSSEGKSTAQPPPVQPQENGHSADITGSHVDDIKKLLQNRDALKAHVVHCFKEVASDEQLDRKGLQKLQELLAVRLDLPTRVLGTSMGDVDFERFDFSGSGTLSVNQAYKLVKFNLAECRTKFGGGAVTVNVPVQPLEVAGYTLIRDLGHGSYGFAKLATNRQGEEVCIKCFPKERMSANTVEDLTHEFETLKLLQCEVVAGASELFQDESVYYMVGDVYHGGDFEMLKERAIGQGVALTEDWWRSVFRQALEGIAFMHEQATIHCDIKEPNIMLKTTNFAEPQVVIIDLGVAVGMAKEDTGDPHGTPGYVPPETLDTLMWFPRGDLFSMGVVMFQLLTDKVPTTSGFRDRSTPGGIFHEGCLDASEIFAATRTRVPPFYLMPKEFPGLTNLVAKLLQKRKEDRPTAAQALKDTWFLGCGEGDVEESWALSDAYKGLRPKNNLATVGITKSFMMDQCPED